MKQATARIRELEQLDSRWAVVHLDCPDLRPAPGQFALADLGGYLLSPVFPRRLAPLSGHRPDRIPLQGHPVSPWTDGATGFSFDMEVTAASDRRPGSTISLLGPCASPARLPASTSRLLLVHDHPGAPRLLPLADEILSRSGAVTLLVTALDAPLAGLSDEIEIQRGPLAASLPDALAWADVVCVDAPLDQLDALRQAIKNARPFADSIPAFALLTPPMPCGVGACDVCFVKTRQGWKRACVEGPLFALNDLLP